MIWGMTIKRMDNVGIVVDDLGAAIAFFIELGMELEGEESGRGTVGRSHHRARRRQVRHRHAADPGRPQPAGAQQVPRAAGQPQDAGPAPVNALGYLRVMFAVDDIDATVAALRAHGAETRRRGGPV